MNLKGVGVALITPFQKNGSVDFPSLAKIIDRLIDNGIDYLVVLGTTSEYPTMTQDEQKAVMMFVRNKVQGRVPLVLGVGSNCTKEVVDTLLHSDLRGYQAILSVCPYYNKPSQRGIIEHFKAVCEASPLPVILYNIPGRTGVNMTPETILEICCSCNNIIGVKEASGNLEQIHHLCEILPKKVAVLSGDDALTVDIIEMGGVGVISVLGHLYPQDFSTVVRQALKGDFHAARMGLLKLEEISRLLFREGNPVGVKQALSLMNECTPEVRLPLVPASEKLTKQLADAMEEYEKQNPSVILKMF